MKLLRHYELLTAAICLGMTACGGGTLAGIPQPSPPPPVVPPPSVTPLPTTWAISNLAPLPGMNAAQANALNVSGDVVGYSVDANGDAHATLWTSGIALELSGMHYAVGMNDSDQVVGYEADSLGMVHALVWDEGNLTDLGVGWLPTGINNSYQISGIDLNKGWGIVWTRELGEVQLSSCTSALAINSKGQVAGISTNGTAALCDTTDFNLPGAGTAINDAGMVVGYESFGAEAADALVFPNNDIHASAIATGVNEFGWVVGQIYNPAGNHKIVGTSHGFIWSKDSGIHDLPLILVAGVKGKFVAGTALVDGVLEAQLLKGN